MHQSVSNNHEQYNCCSTDISAQASDRIELNGKLLVFDCIKLLKNIFLPI